MPVARQLCGASSTVTKHQTLTACPRCGRKLTPDSWVWVVHESKRQRFPVVPAHVRDEKGEVQVRMREDRDRYPR